jgi:hypothetical protein
MRTHAGLLQASLAPRIIVSRQAGGQLSVRVMVKPFLAIYV